jgi:GNAT superfamily N-acetyltransferase
MDDLPRRSRSVNELTEVEIVALGPETWPSLAELFEQGGDPKTCWCTFWRFSNAEAKHMTHIDNRAWLEANATANAGPPIGLVAVHGGVAVGWVSVAPREAFHRLSTSRTIPMLDGDGVWAITCFVIGRVMRGKGLSGPLLRAAIDVAARAGARTIEAYPVGITSDRVPSAAAYTGLESTFIDAGFRRVAVTTSRASGQLRVVVRRDI